MAWIRERDDKKIILFIIMILFILGFVALNPKGLFTVFQEQCSKSINGFTIMRTNDGFPIVTEEICKSFMRKDVSTADVGTFIEKSMGWSAFSGMLQGNVIHNLAVTCKSEYKGNIVSCAYHKAVPFYCCAPE